MLKEVERELANRNRRQLIDFSEVLNDEGKKNVKKGTILGFKKDGKITRYKFEQVNKKSGIYKARMIILFTPEEIEEMERGDAKTQDSDSERS